MWVENLVVVDSLDHVALPTYKVTGGNFIVERLYNLYKYFCDIITNYSHP